MIRFRSSRTLRAASTRARKRVAQLATALALGALALATNAAARDVVRIESVGVADVRAESASPRDAAIRRALLDAVRESAESLLATPPEAEFGDDAIDAAEPEVTQREALQQILGADPLEYATRFQVVEDRGEGPALFGSDPAVETEYVVIVSVFVDRDKIRERLVRAGVMLAPTGQDPEVHSRLILEGISEYWAFAEIRRVLIEELRVRAAIPRAFSPGLAVVDIVSADPPSGYLDSLRRALASQMELVPLRVEATEARIRVNAYARPPLDDGPEDAAAFDTLDRNRY